MKAVPATPGPLAGVRIIDLTWLLVGAGATRMLATLGAEVIKIEPPSPGRLDPMRLRHPYMFNPPRVQPEPEYVDMPPEAQWDRAGNFFNINPQTRHSPQYEPPQKGAIYPVAARRCGDGKFQCPSNGKMGLWLRAIARP